MQIDQDAEIDNAKEVIPVTFFAPNTDPVVADKDFRPGVFNPEVELSQPKVVNKPEIHDPHELPESRKSSLVTRIPKDSPLPEE